jgi:hypothetical protein
MTSVDTFGDVDSNFGIEDRRITVEESSNCSKVGLV